VRIARDFGTVAQLLPDGIADVRDCPHTLFSAIRAALMVIGFDELDEDERPPRRIWLDNDRLADWFKEVRRRRKEKYSAKEPGPIDDPVENDAARSLLVG
jgi:hypothetical protein